MLFAFLFDFLHQRIASGSTSTHDLVFRRTVSLYKIVSIFAKSRIALYIISYYYQYCFKTTEPLRLTKTFAPRLGSQSRWFCIASKGYRPEARGYVICPRATHEGNKSHNHELKADKWLIFTLARIPQRMQKYIDEKCLYCSSFL